MPNSLLYNYNESNMVAQQHVEDDGKVSRTSAKGKWHVLAASIEKQAESHKNVIDAALAFLMAIAKDAQFERQRPVLLPLIRLVEPSTYIDPDDAQRTPYFVGHQWLSSRLLQLKRTIISMEGVIKRCQRFEKIRVQVQGLLMDLGEKRRTSQVNGLRKLPAVPLARSQQEEDEPGDMAEVPKENLDVAAERFAHDLAAGRSGRSSLIWLWGVWKLMHQVLMRRRRKKGELLERTLIGDLVAPLRHWMIFGVENRADSKLITYHTYLQERQMYTRTALDLQNKKEDLVLDLQVSHNSCRRLTRQLEAKRKERQSLHQRLLDVRPDDVRTMLSRVLDLTLIEVLQQGCLQRTRFRLNFLTRDLAPLLMPDEDSPWRLFGFTGDQVLTRWANHQLAQFKLVANEVLEAMSKRNSEEGNVEGEVEWSAREIETYGERCKLVRAMKHLGHLEDDHEGVLFAVIYGAVCANGSNGSQPHPVSLWPLDEKEPEVKAQALCQAIRQVIPTRAKHLLQPNDVMLNTKGGLIPAVLAVIFMSNPTLPCSAKHEILGAASFAIDSAISQEVYKEPRKKKNQDSFTPAELLLEPQQDAQQRAKDLRRRVFAWLDDAERATTVEPGTHADPAPKSIFTQIESLAGAWAIERPQDFSPLLKPEEGQSDLLTIPAHEILLRWANFHLKEIRSVEATGEEPGRNVLPNLNELDLSILLELLTKLAPDVMTIHEDMQKSLEMAPNPAATEAATLRLVVAVANRCSSYQILTEEVLRDGQTDMMAAFLAELMVHRAHLPVGAKTSTGRHMEQLSSIVLEAAKTESVQNLCTYLRNRREHLPSSLEAMRAHEKISEAVKGKMRSFALKMLVKRSQGLPCDMLELAQQLPKGQRGDLVSSSNIQATISREMGRISSQGEQASLLSADLVKTAVEDVLKKHIATFRDVFRQYARECHTLESDTRARTATSSMTIEAAHVLVVSPRHLMKLYRDCRLYVLRLSSLDVEEVYNEVKMQHAFANQFEEVPRFETGLSLEMFVEALLTLACRAHLEDFPPTAFHDKLEHMIESNLIPHAGTKQDDVVYQLLTDESLDEIIEDFSPRLRSIFVAYASSTSERGNKHRHRGAIVKSMATQKQAMTMSLDSLTEMLQHCGLMSETVHRARLGRIYMNLLQLRRFSQDEPDVDEELRSPSLSQEDPDQLTSLLEDDVGASFQYNMSFQEFLDGLIILTLFKEPNPFVAFNTRLEKFLRCGVVDPLFQFANNSSEPRFRSLYQALDDAFQKDVSAQGIKKKLKMAEED